MFQVFDKDGAYITQYANQSEAETYFRSSVTNVEFDAETKAKDGIIVATDADGQPAGEIRGPKPYLEVEVEAGKRSRKRK